MPRPAGTVNCMSEQQWWADDLQGLCRVFEGEARRLEPAASVDSEIWPTVGDMIDHLGNIHRWATEVVSTGVKADRAALERPERADRAEWFAEGATRLHAALAAADADRDCWTLLGPGATAFWRRRMVHETAKHT